MVWPLAAIVMSTQNPLPNPVRDAAISKAEAAVKAAIPTASADPERPTFHPIAPAQWMNDPNGPIFHKGWYHVFYQANPYGDRWDHMHWGHLRSRDLVHWETMPLALWPSETEGERHVFSGSVFPGPDGKPLAFYTSIGDGREPEQWIAVPEDDDLRVWRKEPVRLTQSVHNGKPLTEWRDPYLFKDLGLTYMVVGGGLDGKGVVALYKPSTSDLRSWQYLGVLFTHPDADVHNVECPNLALVDGQWVLLVSVHGRVESFVGDLQNTRFVPHTRGVLGESSYASQIVQGMPDRTVELAWVNTQNHKGWNGYLTLPSELRVARDGTLLRTPVSELVKLRGKATKLGDRTVDGTTALPEVTGETLELELTLEPREAKRAGLRLGGFEIVYDPAARRLRVGDRTVVLPYASVAKGVKLRAFLDHSALDVYAADGAGTLVAHHEAPVSDRQASLFSEGEVRFKGIVVRALKP